ncbi:uncharacterized protein LOC111901150 isoform X2 [Lactuca sativa]|uniref:uncharacterized protein LOC111901150 isoform X2 n=1 Tax=Lactuca sativa TaxID=4236 RepID=UPI001C6935A8|nr:uncharacterized protein LOC111901150 isoform X2 [Lactuca sativa]
MTVDEWPEWLPADWMIQIRKIDDRKVKCYIDPAGRKFYSKPQVDRHFRTLENRVDNEKTNNVDGQTLDLSLEPDEDVPHTNEDPEPEPESTPKGQSTRQRRPGSSSKNYKDTEELFPRYGSSSVSDSRGRKHGDTDWLPDGWDVEVKSKKSGQKYKIYINPKGKKFFSKPQVLSYLSGTLSSPAGQKKGYKTPTQPEKSQISEAKNNETREITESARMAPDYEVISSTPADGLPPGWIKEIRVRNGSSGKKRDPYYLDPLSGYVFFSKLDALRYLDTGDVKKCAIKPLRRDMNHELLQAAADEPEGELASAPEPTKETETPKEVENGGVTESKPEGTVTEKRKVRSITGDGYVPMPKSITGDGHLPMPKPAQKGEAWLPEGWVVEMKSRNDKKIKCYKEIATGKNFYSRPQVMTYLGNTSGISPNTNTNSNSQKRKVRKSYVERDSSPDSGSEEFTRPKRSKKDVSDYKETIVTTPAEGLPPGWIKEIRSRLCGTTLRKDPYYTDPVSGYIFRSKLDALRYLDTGDINLCAIRPRKKDADGNEVAIPDTTPKPPKLQKQLSEGGSDVEGIDMDKEADIDNSETDRKNTENTPGSTPIRRGTRERATKVKPSAAPLPARSSTRLKGVKPHTKTDTSLDGNDNGAGVDVEKQGNEEQLDYQLEDDSSWTDQFDFAVKTLVGEFPPDENGGVGNGSAAKVN